MGTQKTNRRKPNRKQVAAYPLNTPLPRPELLAILQAADEIIAAGGRTLLAKILKGSKEKKLLELGLDHTPAYGFFRELTMEQIVEKVDVLIEAGYLKTELSGKLPMIEFTVYGWTVRRERATEELLREWENWLDQGITPVSMEYLKDRNRGMILMFLFKILCSGDRKYIPFLQQWQSIEFRKVQVEIRQVIADLNERERLVEIEWHELLRERAQSLIVRSRDPVILVCQECDGPFVFDHLDFSCYRADGIYFPEKCPDCRHQEESLHE
ncbi:RQC-minor-1 family DNA-binding protein [Paenibacillus sp. FSL R7-0128]|uniref:RQC-minor-1 family DNA-binding protein n=1 Tax=Paenibacillus sp. FSL R7-0128 TaxID=2954529 RepID=UPI0030F95560